MNLKLQNQKFPWKCVFPIFLLSLYSALNASEQIVDSEIQENSAEIAIRDTLKRQEKVLKDQLNNPFPKSGHWKATNFAFGAYHFNEKIEEADKELILVKDQYKKEWNKDAHWNVYLLGKLYWMYSSNRMGSEAASAIEEIMQMYLTQGEYIKENMWTPKYVWSYHGSENHHLMAYVSAWCSAHIIKNIPKYKDTRVAGIGVEEFALKMDDYFKLYFKEKATKGLFTEIGSPTYTKYSVNVFYTVYDHSKDAELKELARMFLNLYFADWAIEQFNGQRGGSKHRCYREFGYILNEKIGGFPFGLGDLGHHPGLTGAATTAWRPDPLVAELALAQEARGTYGYYSRRPGLRVENKRKGNDLSPNGGQLLRYTYHNPQFIMGMSMVPAIREFSWTAISSQNRQNGILLNGKKMAKIYTQRVTHNKYNMEWGVQDQGVMILQQLPRWLTKHGKERGQLIFLSKNLNITETGGWFFAESEKAYCAIKVVQGTVHQRSPKAKDFGIKKGDPEKDMSHIGTLLDLQNIQSPIIFEVSAKEKYDSIEDFQKEIQANPMVLLEDSVLEYSSKAYGNKLSLFMDYSNLPKINDKTVNLNPEFVYKSPYINGNFGAGTVTISSGGKSVVYDFHNPIPNQKL